MASKPLETGKNLRQIRFFPSRVLFVFNEQIKQERVSFSPSKHPILLWGVILRGK